MKLLLKISNTSIFTIIILWQLLLTFQGFDLADTGFHLTAFRFIYDDPYSVRYSMMFWLSDVAGAYWMKLFPAGGLYWIRLGWVIAITATCMIYLRLLRLALTKRDALITLAITLIFILRGGPECLNYDILTSLGFALGLLFLIQGVTAKKQVSLFISGTIFGISLFFKVSNLTFLAFILIILFAHFLYEHRWSDTIKNCISWISGGIGGIFLIYCLIKLTGHWELFIDNLTFVSQMGVDASASHGLKPLLKSYISGYINAIVMLCLFGLGLYFLIRVLKQKRIVFSEKNNHVLLMSVTIIALISALFLREIFWSKVRYLFLGLMLFYGIIVPVDRSQSPISRILAFSGLILLLIAPLGSDSGLAKSVWGMWLLGPLTLSKLFDLKLISSKIRENQLLLKKALIAVILVSSVVYAWQNTYFDIGSRLVKRSLIDHPKLRYIYTSQKRAKAMDEIITEAFPLIEKEEYLLSFIEIPMFNYLTEKKPFISTSWPKLYYNPEIFRVKLSEAVVKRQALPAIIRQKQETKLNDWPSMSEGKFKQWPEHEIVLNNFIQQYHYQVAWENEMFQLLICPEDQGQNRETASSR